MSKEVLKIALEALEPLKFVGKRMDGGNPKIDEAIAAIKTALEAKDGECKYCTDGCPACDARKLPEQEPVAQPKVRTGNCLRVGVCASEGHKIAPQRTWSGLTNEETIAIELGLRIPTGYRDAYDLSLHDFARAIEAKLKEKNI
jgi:hypothetical protein